MADPSSLLTLVPVMGVPVMGVPVMGVPVMGVPAVGVPAVGMAGAALAGAAVWAFGWAVAGAATARRIEPDSHAGRRRRDAARTDSATFARFEPLVLELAAVVRGVADPGWLGRLEEDVDRDPDAAAWDPAEYVAVQLLEGAACGLAFGLFAALLHPAAGVAAFLGITGLYPMLAAQSLRSEEAKRRAQLKRRLPYAIDLMALMMEAGASFTDGLKAVIDEADGHPLGTAFGEALREIELGRERRDAMLRLAERVPDEDVREFVYAVTKGEELGTPLSQILRSQAEEMRLKRAQWGEKAAAEAQVKIVFPGMGIMIACLLVVVAPFLLHIWNVVEVGEP